MEDEKSMSLTICGNLEHLEGMLEIPSGKLSAREYCEEWLHQAWDAADEWEGPFEVWVSSDRFFVNWRGGKWSQSRPGHWVANGVLAVYYRGCGKQAGEDLLQHVMLWAKSRADSFSSGQSIRGYLDFPVPTLYGDITT